MLLFDSTFALPFRLKLIEDEEKAFQHVPQPNKINRTEEEVNEHR
jgi:hypothetical protein